MSVRRAELQLAGQWGAQGYLTDLGGPLHWIEFDRPDVAPDATDAAPDATDIGRDATDVGRDAGDSAAPATGPVHLAPIVLVHGLGGSHLNWVQIGPALAQSGRRVLALDLAGFGLTPSVGRSAGVQANAALLNRFLREVVSEPAVVVGNSMGGMIAILHASAHPETVVAVALIDPSVPVPRTRPDLQVLRDFALFATPVLGEAYLKAMRTRTSPREQVQRTIELCFADPARAEGPVLDAGVALIEARQGFAGTEHAFLQAARSLVGVLVRADRYRAHLRGLDMPVLLVHGELDRLVSIDAARAVSRLRPDWQYAFLPGVGHTPQLEVPDLVVESLRTWLDTKAGAHTRTEEETRR